MRAAVQLQQGIPRSRTQDEFGQEREITYGIEFEQFLKLWAEHIEDEQKYVRHLCETSMKIHRRARGITLSDQCGSYGTRPETAGRWLDYDADLDGDIHPINIVGPALNTNQNACLQSNSQTEVRSASQSAKHQQNAQRWQRVADYLERTGWDESMRAFIFDAVQKDGTVLIRSYKEKADSQSVANVREKGGMAAMFECPCGEVGVTEAAEDAEEGMGEAVCTSCGQAAPAIVMPEGGFDLEESEVPTYELKSEIIPFYNFTIDTAGAKLRGIQSAEWLQVQKLVSRVKLATKYPDTKFGWGNTANWSYQTLCDYALSSGSFSSLNMADMGSRQEFQKFEERTIYLHADAYSDYVCPTDYEFVNGKGEVTFAIARGQSISEAFEAQYGTDPKGFKFVWINDRLIDICSPEDDTLDFRSCFSDVHWRRDSGSYLSSPYASIVSIQDDLTQLNSMRHNIIARNAAIPVYFDSLVFEEGDFSKEFIGTKNAHLLGDNRDVSKAVVQLPIPAVSPELGNQMQFLLSIKDEISNVTPAMRGEAQRGETFGAQRQQLEQSYGSLTSVLKSFAKCKNDTFIQKAKMAQECWTAEQFMAVGSMFGELWNEEEVEEMCSVNLNKDLVVSYKTGSEMPQSNLDREVRFAQGLAALQPFMEMGVVRPEALQKILEKIDEMAGFDFDLTGLEVNEVLAQKRYLELAKKCAEQGPITFDEIEQLKQSVIAIDEMGQPVTGLTLLTEQVFADADIHFSQWEDLDQQANFYIEQVRVELGKTEPDYLLVEVLHYSIEQIKTVQQQMRMEAMMADPAYQQQMAQEQQAAKGEAVNREREDADKASEREMREKEMTQTGEQAQMQQVMGAAQQMSQQEHEMEMAKMARAGAGEK